MFALLRGLCVAIADANFWNKLQMQFESRRTERGIGRIAPRRRGRRKADAAAIVFSKDLLEDAVELLNQRCGGAEVRCESHRLEGKRLGVRRLQANVADAREQFGIGVAKKVDRLHRVTDYEAGAMGSIGPGGDQMREQLVLATAGVLELVNE